MNDNKEVKAAENVTEANEPEIKKPGKKRNVKATILIIAIILILLSLAVYFALTYIMPMGTYSMAGECVKQGDLSKAIELYRGLGNYRDSEELYFNCVERYSRELIFDDKNYNAAIEILEDISTTDEDIVMLLGYARAAVCVESIQNGDDKALEDLKALVDGDSISGVYNYAAVCISNEEYAKAKILLDLLIERNYLDSQELYAHLLENDPIARAKTIYGRADYAGKMLDVLKSLKIKSVEFSDTDNDGLDEMLLIDENDNMLTYTYTGEAEKIETPHSGIDKSTFITKVKAVGILEEKLISGLKETEAVDITASLSNEDKLLMQNMIDYKRNEKTNPDTWVNSHIEKVYELNSGVYYVKYTYAMRFGSVTLPANDLRSGDFTGGEYLQKYENALNEMYGYAIFGLNQGGEGKYYLGECSDETKEYIDHTRLKSFIG